MKSLVSNLRTIQTQGLRVFVEVARHGGITPASTALGIAKSAISKQLAALEAEIGVRLFERSSRRVVLTREGEALLPRAESILAELQELLFHAEDATAEPRGSVRVAAPPEFGAFLAGHFFPLLLRRHPELSLRMRMDYAMEDLHDPAVDLAFRLGGIGDDRLVARPLSTFARGLYCAPSYAERIGVHAPEDLVRADALLFSDDAFTTKWRLQAVDDARSGCEIAVRGRVALRGFGALLAAAQAGLGVARLPGFMAAPSLGDGRLVRILPQWRTPPLQVFLAYRSGAAKIARVRATIDAALAEVPRLLREADAKAGDVGPDMGGAATQRVGRRRPRAP